MFANGRPAQPCILHCIGNDHAPSVLVVGDPLE
jgi:hypothetical protein